MSDIRQDRNLIEFERALDRLAEALQHCELLLATHQLPVSLLHDDTFQRLLHLLRSEGEGSIELELDAEPDAGEPLAFRAWARRDTLH